MTNFRLRLVRSPARQVSGFTLIELLTVIAIIGILAAILIPVVGRVRHDAARSSCASNLRQVGTAIYLYANDNDGRLPGPAWAGIPFDVRMFTSTPYTGMGYYLAPYLLQDHIAPGQIVRLEVLMSPSYRLNPPPGVAEADIDRHYARTHDSVMPFGHREGSSDDNINGPRRIEELSALYSFKPLSQIWGVRTQHDTPQNGRNYLFFDGHVAFYPRGQNLNNDQAW